MDTANYYKLFGPGGEYGKYAVLALKPGTKGDLELSRHADVGDVTDARITHVDGTNLFDSPVLVVRLTKEQYDHEAGLSRPDPR